MPCVHIILAYLSVLVGNNFITFSEVSLLSIFERVRIARRFRSMQITVINFIFICSFLVSKSVEEKIENLVGPRN